MLRDKDTNFFLLAFLLIDTVLLFIWNKTKTKILCRRGAVAREIGIAKRKNSDLVNP